MIKDATQVYMDMLKATQKVEKGHEYGKSGQQGRGVEGKEVGGDRVTLNASRNEVVTYSKPVGEAARFLVTSQIVSTLVTQQSGVGAIGEEGGTLNSQIAQLFGKLGISTTLDIGGGNTADLANLSQADAQALIASDGYWGVEQTSDRIAAFALNAAGNDPEKLQKVKNAVMQGYEMAKVSFGGFLPDISEKTIDAVLAKLNNPSQQDDQNVTA
ncbi:MAG: hypothetical protein OEV28_00765 [Nitrospirota bacterium]|nr:hypothetical protein [Nitrospirota bacterium]